MSGYIKTTGDFAKWFTSVKVTALEMPDLYAAVLECESNDRWSVVDCKGAFIVARKCSLDGVYIASRMAQAKFLTMLGHKYKRKGMGSIGDAYDSRKRS